MAFTTPAFLIFFALACCGYFALPHRYRNAFLLLASLVFYAWALPAYCAVVLGTAALGYFAAFYISRAETLKSRRARLALSIALLAAVLFVFKYFDFFAAFISSLTGGEAVSLSLAQPLGISFYTLQLIGYLVDVYRGDAPERDFVAFALFTSFFPYVISGPVARSRELLPQFKKRRDFEYSRASNGLQRFLWGAFKKVVIADGLGALVNGVYADLASYTGLAALAAVAFYAVQIYCDFSGYTDMAVGVACFLGFDLRENFCAPYGACGITDFWSRWHMSLTSWLRDYVYIPLGGNRKGFARKLLNILIVFAISGLWHGVGFTFIVWGLWHAFFRILDELLAKKLGERFSRPTGLFRALRIVVSDVIVAAGWVLFRAPTFADAFTVIANCFKPLGARLAVEQLSYLATQNVAGDRAFILFYFGVIALGLILCAVFGRKIRRSALAGRPQAYNPLYGIKPAAKWALCVAMGLCVMFFYIISATRGAQSASFIYGGF